MRRPHCPFCQRPVRRLWLWCRVCGTRLAPWYGLALIILITVTALFALIIFRETLAPPF